MATLDPTKNFAIVTVSTGYDNDDTSIVLTTGHGAKLPAPATDGAFNLVWWDSTTYPDPSDDPNVEIVRVTARSTDTLTVTRAQEGTSGSNKNTGGKTYKMILAVTKKMVDDMAGLVPSGTLIMWPTGSAPTGYLLCDGSLVSRTTYANLFNVIGTTFGAGDGSTTFALPDFRGRMAIGVGSGSKVATFASRSGNVITVTGLTNANNNEFQTGQAVTYSAPSGAISGLTHNTVYYIIRQSNTSFALATTLANAQNGSQITLSSDGTGAQTFTLALTARTLADTGGEENHAMSSSELLAHSHNSVIAVFPSGGSQRPSASTGSTSSTSNTQGGNAAMSIMSPFLAVNYAIKT